ncbi:hypothetical protein VPHK391_0020 [Vibrio phage K391]
MSGEAKFTKGPWAWGCDNDTATIIQVFSESDEAKGDPDICKLQHEPNASLIAAAPEMYETLETILEIGKLSSHQEDIVSKLLAKARGEL